MFDAASDMATDAEGESVNIVNTVDNLDVVAVKVSTVSEGSGNKTSCSRKI